MMQEKLDINEYINWLIESHDDIKNISAAVRKIAEIACSKPRSVYYWKNGSITADEAKEKLLKMYREVHK